MTTILAPSAEFERTITGLTAGTQYRFRVRARNANGYGPYSAWSTPGTPTSGTPAPPPNTPTLTVTVTGAYRQRTSLNACGLAAYDSAKADVSAAISGAGLLSTLSFTWQGRYLRTVTQSPSQSTGYVGGWRFSTTSDSTWRNLAPTYVGGTQANLFEQCDTSKSYRIIPIPNSGSSGPSLYLFAWLNNANIGFRPHFWELRCVASGTVLLDGQATNVSGVSRTIPFKEMWNGIDYPTDVIPILP